MTHPTRYHCDTITHRTSPDSAWPLRRAYGTKLYEKPLARPLCHAYGGDIEGKEQ